MVSWLNNEGVIARDPERIDPFLDQLRELWVQWPDMRFGQLVVVLGLNDFNREDADSAALIDNRIQWNKEAKSSK